MKKPSWLMPLDVASFLGPASVAAALTIYAILEGAEGPKGWIWLCWSVVLVFTLIWGRLVWLRKKWIDTFRWYPAYGFMVSPENFSLPNDPDFNAVVAGVIKGWKSCFPSTESIVKKEVNWVWFEKGLDESTKNLTGKKVYGFVISNTRIMHVDYNTPNDLLTSTSFEHELGHIIQGYATGSWIQSFHHAFAKKNGLK